MQLRPSKWKVGHLVAAWGVYWLGLAVWGLGSLMPIIWRLTRPEAHGTAGASFDGGRITVTAVEGATTVWKGQITFHALVLLIAVPPLILWGLWLWTRPRLPSEPERLIDGHAAEREVSRPDVVAERSRKRPGD